MKGKGIVRVRGDKVRVRVGESDSESDKQKLDKNPQSKMGPMQCGISGVCQETESGTVHKCMNQDHKLLERGSLCTSL